MRPTFNKFPIPLEASVALKELLKSQRYRQVDLVRAARKLGSNLSPSLLSKILSGTEPISERRAEELRAALLSLGFKERQIRCALRAAMAVI
jgi:Holliday junction resolvasome RuvABC DNA-binding subunit